MSRALPPALCSALNCLRENNIAPEDVVFVAHSTTQATNAFIEGDVAQVGVIGVAGGGLEGWLAKPQLRLKDIILDEKVGRKITIHNDFIKKKQLNNDTINASIDKLKGEGSEVIVASMAFGVDSGTEEEQIHDCAQAKGIPVTMASDITKLYGLTRRTRTAAINAAILPKMMATANATESSVRAAGVTVPLMIMRGDGGVMEISEMRKRPILTAMSGPAASVMGSLMYLRASNAVYFEVGGTTTNIGVIKNGRPGVDYAIIGGHPTYINSLDVRILGTAGGSMVRINDQGSRRRRPAFRPHRRLRIRRLHARGRDRRPAGRADPAQEGRPRRLRRHPPCQRPSASPSRTPAPRTSWASSSRSTSRTAMPTPRARPCSRSPTSWASPLRSWPARSWDKSFEKVNQCITELAEKYQLDHDQIKLVGCGGGAAALICYCAEKMDVPYSIPENAEVISSIGVALAMVRDVVERIVPNPTQKDIAELKKEAMDAAIGSGAAPDTIEVHIEIDSQTG